MLALALLACAAHIATAPAPFDSRSERTVAQLSEPGPIVIEEVVSATWAVPLGGLLDLNHPETAGLDNDDFPIVLPVYLLTHPVHGTFIIDTGIAREPVARGLVASFLKDVEVVEPLGAILDRQEQPLAGVLLTHTHSDHVLGLPDVPRDVPILAGPGEEDIRSLGVRLTYGLLRDGLGDRPLHIWDFQAAGPLGPVEHAVDLFGDGSLFALHVPGHTPGSTAYLARTADGPVLFTGDCSHTQWGWDHGVSPGRYTEDHDANVASLAMLKALAEAVPGLQVRVGHEL